MTQFSKILLTLKKLNFSLASQEDVMQRILDVSIFERHRYNLQSYCNNPLTSNELFQICLESHFLNGSDHSSCIGAPIGLTPRFITVEALKRIKNYFPNAIYSEYLPYFLKTIQRILKSTM